MIKRTLVISLIIVAAATLAYAGPYLVCDPDPVAESYVVVLDNGEQIETPAPLRYDLANIDEGQHVVEVQAKNKWGVSSAVPLEFQKTLPVSPTNLRLGE